jgi:hypothetical protein
VGNASRPFLRAGQDYFTEFLAELDLVTVPKGETLKAAFERAKTKSPPEKVLIHPNSPANNFYNWGIGGYHGATGVPIQTYIPALFQQTCAACGQQPLKPVRV